jgi:hypothetical protein
MHKVLQLRLRQFAVSDDSDQVAADLADDIDGEKQFLAAPTSSREGSDTAQVWLSRMLTRAYVIAFACRGI